jgi:hypothetical protein
MDYYEQNQEIVIYIIIEDVPNFIKYSGSGKIEIVCRFGSSSIEQGIRYAVLQLHAARVIAGETCADWRSYLACLFNPGRLR